MPAKYKTVNCYSNKIIKLPDTADAFRRRFRSSRRSTLTPLWSFTDTLASLVPLTSRRSVSRWSPNENASILAWLVTRAYFHLKCAAARYSSLADYIELCHTPVLRKSANLIPHKKSCYSLRITIPKKSFSADACRPKSA